jgi:hypothetical protein
MKDNNVIRIESVIDKEIAQIMASSGDLPDEFIERMRKLIIKWYCKGLAAGIETERKHNDKS